MLESKFIQIEFANENIKAVDAMKDIYDGIKSASLNLYSRYDVHIETPTICGGDKVVVELRIPKEIISTFLIGPHLKGIASYLLKNCNHKYDEYLVGKRLLVYTEIATPDMSNNKFTLVDRLEAISKFAKLLERSDSDAMEAITNILNILKNTGDASVKYYRGE